MDKMRAKIKATSRVAFVMTLAIVLLFGITTSVSIAGWLTTGGGMSSTDSALSGALLIRNGLLVALAAYVAFIFLRINREETPFFAALPRMIKMAAVFLFVALQVPKWLVYVVLNVQAGTSSFVFIDSSTIFAFMLAAVVFCLGQIIEYGYLVQDENFEII